MTLAFTTCKREAQGEGFGNPEDFAGSWAFAGRRGFVDSRYFVGRPGFVHIDFDHNRPGRGYCHRWKEN